MKIVIIGASSLGKSVVFFAREIPELQVIGVLDDDTQTRDIAEVPYMGPVENMDTIKRQHDGFGVVIAAGSPQVRYRIFERITADSPGIKLASIVHPSVAGIGGAQIGDGCIIFPGCVIGATAVVGMCSVINANVSVGAGARLGPFSTLCPGVNVGSDVSTGIGVYVGMGGAVAQQVRLDDWCTIGALSFARDDVPAGKVAVGSPARVKRRS